MWDFESVSLVFFNIVSKWCLISRTQHDRNPAETNLYTTNDFRAAGDAFFHENKSFNLNGEKVTLVLVLLQDVLHHFFKFHC